jgi:hypothetical protein
MRTVALSLAINLAACALPAAAVAQVQELPNVPLVASGGQEKSWTHADGTKFHYLEWGTGTPVIQPVEHAARDARSQLVRARQEIPII